MQDAAAAEQCFVQILRGHVAGSAVFAVVKHAALARAGLLEHHTGAVGGVKVHTAAVHAFGPDLIADVLPKFIRPQAADPGGRHAKFCSTDGSVALSPCNAETVVWHIAQRARAVRCKSGHGFAKGQAFRHYDPLLFRYFIQVLPF